MAKKKAKRKSVAKTFYIGSTDCGDMNQFKIYEVGPFVSIESAKAYIAKQITDGEWEACQMMIIQKVATGKPSGNLDWK